MSGPTITSDRFGNAGNAYDFDGNGNGIEIPNLVMDGILDFSVGVWVKTNKNGTGIISGANSSYFNEFLIFSNNTTSEVRAYIHSNHYSQNALNGTQSIIENSWHHIVIVRTGNTGNISIYIDG